MVSRFCGATGQIQLPSSSGEGCGRCRCCGSEEICCVRHKPARVQGAEQTSVTLLEPHTLAPTVLLGGSEARGVGPGCV
jgi:hypothetical protein